MKRDEELQLSVQVNQVLAEVLGERIKQHEKFGEQNHDPITFMAILMEEVGEASKEAVDHKFNFPPPEGSSFSQYHHQKNRLKNYRKEMIQWSNPKTHNISMIRNT